MNKYFYIFDSSLSTQGSNKARSDVGKILEQEGYVNKAPKFLIKVVELTENNSVSSTAISTDGETSSNSRATLINRIIGKILNNKKISYFSQKCLSLLTIPIIFFSVLFLEKSSIIAINYPQINRYRDSLVFKFANQLKKSKDFKLIAIIHDIYPLFTGRPAQNELEKVELLEDYSAIISHNKEMTKYLVDQGISPEKIVNLEIFDYLLDGNLEEAKVEDRNSIFIAGNLEKGKTSFLTELSSLDSVSFNLYGPNYPEEFSKIKNPVIKYFGSFPPHELVDKLEGAYGLVWDSRSSVGGKGILGNYQRYNNPHKTSLYLATGFPVITWSESAIAPFIVNNQLGFVVGDLKELTEKFSSISEEDYKVMQKNVVEMAEKIRNGYFLSHAIQQAEIVVQK